MNKVANEEYYPEYFGKVFYTFQNGEENVLIWDYSLIGASKAGWNQGDLVLYLGNKEFLWIQGGLKRWIYHDHNIKWNKHFIPIEEYVAAQVRAGTI